jgi:hypothetical protein
VSFRSHYLPRSRTGWMPVLAGVGVGLAVLYVTLVTVPHALGVHGAIWSLAANFATCITVSAFTRPPSDETVERIHGAVEDYVYGSGEAGLEEALSRSQGGSEGLLSRSQGGSR